MICFIASVDTPSWAQEFISLPADDRLVRRRTPPSQTWKTFLRNHAEAIAPIDMAQAEGERKVRRGAFWRV